MVKKALHLRFHYSRFFRFFQEEIQAFKVYNIFLALHQMVQSDQISSNELDDFKHHSYQAYPSINHVRIDWNLDLEEHTSSFGWSSSPEYCISID